VTSTRPPAQVGIPGQRRAHRHACLPGGHDPRRPNRQPPGTLRPIRTRTRPPGPRTARPEARRDDERAVRGMVRAATTRQTTCSPRYPHTSADARVIALHSRSPIPTARAAPHRGPREPATAPAAAPTMPPRRTHSQARLRSDPRRLVTAPHGFGKEDAPAADTRRAAGRAASPARLLRPLSRIAAGIRASAWPGPACRTAWPLNWWVLR
jgi:hypothetical protein